MLEAKYPVGSKETPVGSPRWDCDIEDRSEHLRWCVDMLKCNNVYIVEGLKNSTEKLVSRTKLATFSGT